MNKHHGLYESEEKTLSVMLAEEEEEKERERRQRKHTKKLEEGIEQWRKCYSLSVTLHTKYVCIWMFGLIKVFYL